MLDNARRSNLRARAEARTEAEGDLGLDDDDLGFIDDTLVGDDGDLDYVDDTRIGDDDHTADFIQAGRLPPPPAYEHEHID